MEKDLETCLSASRQHEPKFTPPIDNDATRAIPIIKEQHSFDDVAKTKKIEPVRPVKSTPTEAPKQLPEKPKKKKWTVMIGTLVTLAILILVLVFALTPTKKEVPDVANLTVEEATEILEDAGFKLGEQIERTTMKLKKTLSLKRIQKLVYLVQREQKLN